MSVSDCSCCARGKSLFLYLVPQRPPPLSKTERHASEIDDSVECPQENFEMALGFAQRLINSVAATVPASLRDCRKIVEGAFDDINISGASRGSTLQEIYWSLFHSSVSLVLAMYKCTIVTDQYSIGSPPCHNESVQLISSEDSSTSHLNLMSYSRGERLVTFTTTSLHKQAILRRRSNISWVPFLQSWHRE